MAIVFDGKKTKLTETPLADVSLQSFIHPDIRFHEGYDTKTLGAPDVRFSFGLHTIEAHGIWPATRFDIAEVSYCIQGKGILVSNGIEHPFEEGYVIYIPKHEIRIFKNLLSSPLKFLTIVDPAWQPEYETMLEGSY